MSILLYITLHYIRLDCALINLLGGDSVIIPRLHPGIVSEIVVTDCLAHLDFTLDVHCIVMPVPTHK